MHVRSRLAFILVLANCFGIGDLQATSPDDNAVNSRRNEQVIEPTKTIANGQVTVVRTSASPNRELLVHFHGAVQTMRTALARSQFNGTLVIVNFAGLSSAYSKPFEADAKLLDIVLELGRPKDRRQANAEADVVMLSSFSAGYGAVREILKQPRNFDRISTIVAADSIYAGLYAEEPKRDVSEANMRDFLRFATLAAQGEKTFVISHSAQRTNYASTTETADYLLRELLMTRAERRKPLAATMTLSSEASRERLIVLGFEGESAEDHMQHLRNIDLLWDRCIAK